MYRHPFDPVSFVPGIFFTVIALTVLGAGAGFFEIRPEVTFPAVALLAGVALVASSFRPSKRTPALAGASDTDLDADADLTTDDSDLDLT